MGVCPSTGQYIIHDTEKHALRFARTMMRLPEDLKWDMTSIELISVTPFDQHAAHDPEVAFQERPEISGDTDVMKKSNARTLYIKGDNFGAFGYTVRCPRCTHERRYGPGRTTKGHSDAYRQRVADELSETPE